MREILPGLVVCFSHHLLLLDSSLVLLALCHLEEYTKEAKGAHHEDYKEVHDLESKVTLLFEVIPLISDGLNLLIIYWRASNRSWLATLSCEHRRLVCRSNVVL